MWPATPKGEASLAAAGTMREESRRETAKWWGTGLALVPLFVLITVFGYVLVLSLGGVLASPFIDFPDDTEDPFLGGTVGLALIGLFAGVPFFSVVCIVYLTILRRLAARGWDDRRLRRAAVVGGVLLTAPFVILMPIGALFGVTVPLPDADAETRRRALVRASAYAFGLFLLLLPLSIIVPT